jgi:hypothetical protein
MRLLWSSLACGASTSVRIWQTGAERSVVTARLGVEGRPRRCRDLYARAGLADVSIRGRELPVPCAIRLT